MGHGRDVGRKYVGGIGCGSASAGVAGVLLVVGSGECVVWFFFFLFVSLGCDSSLMHVVCVCVLVVVDWFCLSFFFSVTLVSFLMVYLVCEVCLFLQV